MLILKIAKWTVLGLGVVLTGVYLFLGVTRHDWFGWAIVGPALLLFFTAPLFLVDRQIGGGIRPSQYRDAPIAIGTVRSVRTTGLTVNDAPQLEVVLDADAPDGRSFPARFRQIVSLAELGVFQVGLVVPVRYRPELVEEALRSGSTEPVLVMLAVDAPDDAKQDAYNRAQLAKGLMTPRQMRIATHGIDSDAVVLALAPTGEIRDGRSVANITLRVRRPDGTTFDLAQEKALQQAMVPFVQVGSAVRVKYLPDDESEVSIVVDPNAPRR